MVVPNGFPVGWKRIIGRPTKKPRLCAGLLAVVLVHCTAKHSGCAVLLGQCFIHGLPGQLGVRFQNIPLHGFVFFGQMLGEMV